MVPFDTQSPFVTSGIRIGSPAITSRGMTTSDSAQIVDWIDRVLTNHDQESTLIEVRKEVNEFALSFPLFPDEVMNAQPV